MRYYANPCSPAVVDAMVAGHLGLIDTPNQRTQEATARAHDAQVPWCADNGCFSARWDPDYWWAWLVRRSKWADTCAFAAAPDVVADATATAERSAPWLPRIHDLGYQVAYVAQDGITDPPWDQLDVLFIGGSTEWKLGTDAAALVARAVARGVPVHLGRVNSLSRYTYARAIGCSSADGTYLTYGPDQLLPVVLGWVATAGQPVQHHLI